MLGSLAEKSSEKEEKGEVVATLGTSLFADGASRADAIAALVSLRVVRSLPCGKESLLCCRLRRGNGCTCGKAAIVARVPKPTPHVRRAHGKLGKRGDSKRTARCTLSESPPIELVTKKWVRT